MSKLKTATLTGLLLSGIAVSAEAQTVIHAGSLLDVPGQDPKREQSILIEDGKITEIRDGYVSADSLGADWTLVDLSDSFVLPGMIDSHVHLQGELGPNRKITAVENEDATAAFTAAMFAKRDLMAGFTTVRDAGGSPKVILPLRDAINKGQVPGPRIIAAGDSVNATGGHGDTHGFREDVLGLLVSDGNCDGADDCRRAVRAQVKRGSDFIKITATGGVLSETAAGTGQQMFDDELEAVMATAHSLGRKVAAHAHDAGGINAALRAGVDSIEHGTYLDDESIRLFKEGGAYLVPTMLAGQTVFEMATNQSFMPAPIREKSLKVGPQIKGSTKRAYEAGVKIAFGTDTGVSRHGDNARELELMKEIGIPEDEILVMVTINAADLLDISDITGTLEPGKSADIIAVDGNPLENISELRDVDFIMKEGVVYK